MIEIDYARALELVNQAIEEKGEDYVYTNEEGVVASSNSASKCYNWHMDEGALVPGCIVGNALNRGGVELGQMLKNASAHDLTDDLFGSEIAHVTDKAVSFLNRVQVSQDKGVSWGEARDGAKAYIDNSPGFNEDESYNN